ncbi:dTTP/UTP pyrophosphatase [Toxorhynchites rutilus septentrionalis]|uniref:dTTP/UTP pyrophosphatase n=1 Tax=Toxorhynchites rutilus septentrionalis TaxID=329112 RepID=UPI002479CFC8|nr:dTTP/UTP pyrophosphatase [Toxorhynchites rutilus septentrionalis]
MLNPIISKIGRKRVVLASGSPRRQELIQNIGLSNVQLCPSTFEENLNQADYTFAEYVAETAYHKVCEVYRRLSSSENPSLRPDIVIGADTMVTMDGKMYGKPKTPENAFQMLSELMGRQHIVYTGVVIKYHDKEVKFTEACKVNFGKATGAQIQAYVDTGEPLDKAGGYGIQGIGGTFVEKIEGDYFTVVGLPLYRISVELCKLFGYDVAK